MMTAIGQILALDLAVRTGWALGRVLDRDPMSGSVQLVKPGASLAAVYSATRQWLEFFLRDNPTIQTVVFEAPLVPMHRRGKTNIETIRSLIGQAAVVEEFLNTKGGYDVREAAVREVRTHFLGSNRHKREEAKALTIAACRRLGWKPIDDNAADALALWHYQVSIFEPQLAIQTSALFRRR